MKTFAAVSRGVDLDNASHLPSIFSGDAGSVNAHRLDIVRFDFRA